VDFAGGAGRGRGGGEGEGRGDAALWSVTGNRVSRAARAGRGIVAYLGLGFDNRDISYRWRDSERRQVIAARIVCLYTSVIRRHNTLSRASVRR